MTDSSTSTLTRLDNSDILCVRKVQRGHFRHALFDFDGTISLLREGWQAIMAPVCIDMIRGEHAITSEIEDAVHKMIDETTGIQTIYQMECLVELVRSFGLVPENRILSPEAYKEIYNERLLVPVRARLSKLASGEWQPENALVKGIRPFIEGLRDRGVTLYVFSGTDRHDVQNEARALGVDHYFAEIWGALPSKEAYSKEKVIRELIAAHDLHGHEVLAIGDGPVELQNVKEHGGVALGIASDEQRGQGWDDAKKQRLLKAGADLLVPDFREHERLLAHLFEEEA